METIAGGQGCKCCQSGTFKKIMKVCFVSVVYLEYKRSFCTLFVLTHFFKCAECHWGSYSRVGCDLGFSRHLQQCMNRFFVCCGPASTLLYLLSLQCKILSHMQMLSSMYQPWSKTASIPIGYSKPEFYYWPYNVLFSLDFLHRSTLLAELKSNQTVSILTAPPKKLAIPVDRYCCFTLQNSFYTICHFLQQYDSNQPAQACFRRQTNNPRRDMTYQTRNKNVECYYFESGVTFSCAT